MDVYRSQTGRRIDTVEKVAGELLSSYRVLCQCVPPQGVVAKDCRRNRAGICFSVSSRDHKYHERSEPWHVDIVMAKFLSHCFSPRGSCTSGFFGLSLSGSACENSQISRLGLHFGPCCILEGPQASKPRSMTEIGAISLK